MAALIALGVALFFVPALIELRKPRDAGPRMLLEDPVAAAFSRLKTQLVDVEEAIGVSAFRDWVFAPSLLDVEV